MSFLIEILMIIHSCLPMIFHNGAYRVAVLGVFLIGIAWLFTIAELEKLLNEVPQNQRVGSLNGVIFTVTVAILFFAITGYVMSV
jgi:hypothetical protein